MEATGSLKHYKTRQDYESLRKVKDGAKSVAEQLSTKADKVKADLAEAAKAEISPEAQQKNKNLKEDIKKDAKDLAKSNLPSLPGLPGLPLPIPTSLPSFAGLKSSSTKAEKVAKTDTIARIDPKENKNRDENPAIFFIGGFTMGGLLEDETAMKEMSNFFPVAKYMDWNKKDEIIAEIKKHQDNSPVILVGRGFGGHTAVQVANELNNTKNSFKEVDLLVTIDAKGFNNTIIPSNVKNHKNYIGDGMFSDSAHIAKNSEKTLVENHLLVGDQIDIEKNMDLQFNIVDSVTSNVQSYDKEKKMIVALSDILQNMIDKGEILFLKE